MEQTKTKNKILTWSSRALFCLSIVFFAGYFLATNDLTLRGFERRDLNLKLQEIKNDKVKLEAIAMELKSYERVGSEVKRIGMVDSTNADYLSAAPVVVAKR